MSRISALFMVLLLPLAAANARAEQKSWHFSSPRLVPCEGIGFTGSFSTNVRADFERVDDGIRITHLDVAVDSAAFSSGGAKASGRILVNGKATALVVPWYDQISSATNTAVQLVLPAAVAGSKDPRQRPLQIAAGSNVVIETAAVVGTGSGSCALGSSQSALEF